MAYSDKQLKFIIDHYSFLEDNEMGWDDIAREFSIEFGEKKTGNAIKKTYYREMKKLGDEALSDDTLVKNIQTTYNARKTSSKLRKEIKALAEKQLTYEEFLEQLKNIEAKTPINIHKKVTLKCKKKMNRTAVAHLADNHIGAIIQNSAMDGINEFNIKNAARRIAHFVRTTCQYKVHHRKETELVLVFNGDNIHGCIHGTDTQNVLPMSLQHAFALRIYSQAISFLAQHFGRIRVACTVGNHSRFTHKLNKGRQTEEKWDSFETILHLSLKERFKSYKNVNFVISESPYIIMDIQGHKALITHGDTVINVGNPGKSINVENITKQINAISAGLGTKIDIVLTGHVHKATYIVLDNGTHLIINGPLSGTDEYAQSLGIISNNPIQQIFEVTPDCVVGDMRFVRVDQGDKDKSLDQIIEVDTKLFGE